MPEAGTASRNLSSVRLLTPFGWSGRRVESRHGSTTQQDPTALLLAWGQGDQAAFDALVPLVHDELHQIARRHMAKERRGHTLQATAW